VADFLGSANLFRARVSEGALVLSDGTRLSAEVPFPDAEGEGERLFAIRPEVLTVVPEGGGPVPPGADEMVRIDATVSGRSRIGGTEEISVQAGPLRLVAQAGGSAAKTHFRPGDRVSLFVRAKEIVPLLGADGGESLGGAPKTSPPR
jgi:hypothetical protein